MLVRELILLIEKSEEMFYDHFSVSYQKDKIELQFIENRWRHRTTPYAGEWLITETPLLIFGLDLIELESKIKFFLLMEYYCYSSGLLENQFRKAKIKKALGNTTCLNFAIEMEQFKKEFAKMIQSVLDPNIKRIK